MSSAVAVHTLEGSALARVQTPRLIRSVIYAAETRGNRRLPGTTQRDLCVLVSLNRQVDLHEPIEQPNSW
jgi:hypothetical protein